MPKKAPSKRKKADASVKKDISAAVNTLPELIAKEVYVPADLPASAEPDPTFKRKTAAVSPRPEDAGKRRVMWIGVVTTVLVVFTMWIWNARAVLYDLAGKKSSESHLFNEAKSDLDNIFDGFSLHSTTAKTPTDEPAEAAPAEPAPNENDIKSALETLVASPSPEPEQEVLGITISSEPTTTPAFPSSGVRTTTEFIE